jgi:hypothetical protein
MSLVNGSSSETESVRLCRRKAIECQRTALTTIDPTLRHRYLHLAKLWREIANEAERRTNGSSLSKQGGVVLSFKKPDKRSSERRYTSDGALA